MDRLLAFDLCKPGDEGDTGHCLYSNRVDVQGCCLRPPSLQVITFLQTEHPAFVSSAVNSFLALRRVVWNILKLLKTLIKLIICIGREHDDHPIGELYRWLELDVQQGHLHSSSFRVSWQSFLVPFCPIQAYRVRYTYSTMMAYQNSLV